MGGSVRKKWIQVDRSTRIPSSVRILLSFNPLTPRLVRLNVHGDDSLYLGLD